MPSCPRAAGRAVDPQRLPASHPWREGVEIRKVGVVVDVEVGEEEVVDRRQRDRHGDDVAHAAGTEVEEEALAVAEFDHDAGAGLCSVTGIGVLPMNEIRISSGSEPSCPG